MASGLGVGAGMGGTVNEGLNSANAASKSLIDWSEGDGLATSGAG